MYSVILLCSVSVLYFGSILSPAQAVRCEGTARYTLTFRSEWTRETHPDFPRIPHFSRLIGCSHNASYVMWKSGIKASEGVKDVAEEGSVRTLHHEMDEQINLERIHKKYQGSGIFGGTGTSSIDGIEVESNYPLVSFITMIAPSPDWFVGVHGFDLCDGATGKWRDAVTSDLPAYDAGTDSGTRFESRDKRTVPQENIFLITNDTEGSFYGSKAIKGFGTFRFVKTYDSNPVLMPSMVTELKSSSAARPQHSPTSSIEQVQPNAIVNAVDKSSKINPEESHTPLVTLQQIQPSASDNAASSTVINGPEENHKPSLILQKIQKSHSNNAKSSKNATEQQSEKEASVLAATPASAKTIMTEPIVPNLPPATLQQIRASSKSQPGSSTIVTEPKTSSAPRPTTQQGQPGDSVIAIPVAVGNATITGPSKTTLPTSSSQQAQPSAIVNALVNPVNPTIANEPKTKSTRLPVIQPASQLSSSVIDNANVVAKVIVTVSSEAIKPSSPTRNVRPTAIVHALVESNKTDSKESHTPSLLVQKIRPSVSKNVAKSTTINNRQENSTPPTTTRQSSPSANPVANAVSNANKIDSEETRIPPSTMQKIQPSVIVNALAGSVTDPKERLTPSLSPQQIQASVTKKTESSSAITKPKENATPLPTVQQNQFTSSVIEVANVVANVPKQSETTLPPSPTQHIQPTAIVNALTNNNVAAPQENHSASSIIRKIHASASENVGGATIINKIEKKPTPHSTIQRIEPSVGERATANPIQIDSVRAPTPHLTPQPQPSTQNNVDAPTVVPIPTTEKTNPGASVIAAGHAVVNAIVAGPGPTHLPNSTLQQIQPSSNSNPGSSAIVTEPKTSSTPPPAMQQGLVDSSAIHVDKVMTESSKTVIQPSSSQQVQASAIDNALPNMNIAIPKESIDNANVVDVIITASSKTLIQPSISQQVQQSVIVNALATGNINKPNETSPTPKSNPKENTKPPSTLKPVQLVESENTGQSTIAADLQKSSTQRANLLQAKPSETVNAVVDGASITNAPSLMISRIQPSATIVKNPIENSTPLPTVRPAPLTEPSKTTIPQGIRSSASENARSSTVMNKPKDNSTPPLTTPQSHLGASAIAIAKAIANAATTDHSEPTLASSTRQQSEASAVVKAPTESDTIHPKESHATFTKATQQVKPSPSKNAVSSEIVGKLEENLTPIPTTQPSVAVNGKSSTDSLQAEAKVSSTPRLTSQQIPSTASPKSTAEGVKKDPTQSSKPHSNVLLNRRPAINTILNFRQGPEASGSSAHDIIPDPKEPTIPPTTQKVRRPANLNSREPVIIIDHEETPPPYLRHRKCWCVWY